MHINYLPPEVLTKIFSYLPQHGLLTAVNIVCLYWNEVAFSNSLWKTIEFVKFERFRFFPISKNFIR
jgi:hypothetical protein